MKNEFEKKFIEQTYWDQSRGVRLPRLTLTDMDLLSNVQVHREQLKMLHHLDSSVNALTRTLGRGISATPYGFADWMDSLGGAIFAVKDAVQDLNKQQEKQTRALVRIAKALEDSSSVCNEAEDEWTDEDWQDFNDAVERND